MEKPQTVLWREAALHKGNAEVTLLVCAEQWTVSVCLGVFKVVKKKMNRRTVLIRVMFGQQFFR